MTAHDSDQRGGRFALLRSGFARNFGWMLGAEGVVRISRLVTAVVLARHLDPVAFGVAALALASHELLRVLSHNGFGLKLIRCADEQVDRVSNTLYVLNWLWCGILFAVQCVAGLVVARAFGEPELAFMLALLGGVHLLMPLGLSQMYLVQRQGRLKATAFIDGGQVAVDNVLTAVLAVAGFGAWSIVLPKLIVVPIWIVGNRRAEPWRYRRAAGFIRWRDAFTDTRGVLTSEIARSLRGQMDILVIGRMLGTEALGVYYFAKNSGLGISLAILQAATHAMLPQFGDAVRRHGGGARLRLEVRNVFLLLAVTIVPVVLAQALLAPVYVPLVFGAQWTTAVPVLMLLCLSAIPLIYGSASVQLARAAGLSRSDARWSLWLTPIFLIAVVAGSGHGLAGAALAICLFQWLAQPALSFSLLTQALACIIHEGSRMMPVRAECSAQAWSANQARCYGESEGQAMCQHGPAGPR